MPKQPNMDETPSIIEQPELPDAELIRKRAYAIYLGRAMAHGHDVEDWLRAEEEICSKTSSVVEDVAA